MRISSTKITELVAQNYVYASVLHYFGIEFYNYSEQTLAQVCKEKGLDITKVIAKLEDAVEERKDPAVVKLPLDLVIEYLKHMHYVFVKQRLPYIANLIDHIKSSHTLHHRVAKDLKMVFPLFVEDFILHIYEEEDEVFSYINFLAKAIQFKCNYAQLYYTLEKKSIQDFATKHHDHDDEMKGIRKITENYTLQDASDQHMCVLYAELKAFEKELIMHASVEDEVLLPKALELENQVRKMFEKKALLN